MAIERHLQCTGVEEIAAVTALLRRGQSETSISSAVPISLPSRLRRLWQRWPRSLLIGRQVEWSASSSGFRPLCIPLCICW